MNFTTSQTQTRKTVFGLLKPWMAVGLLLLTAAGLSAEDGASLSETIARTVFKPAAIESAADGVFASSRPESRSKSPFFATPRESRTRDPDRPKEQADPKKPKEKESVSDAWKIRQKITNRYRNPVTMRFLESLSPERALQLYVESSQLIDARHLKPTSYDVRVKRAATNLWYAVNNRAFLEAHRLNPSPAQVKGFRQALQQLMESRPVRGYGDATNMLYQTADLANRHLGLRPATVAVEFVYGAAESLDKYSTFLPDDVSRQPSAGLEELDDHVVGIGVEIKSHELGALILRVIQGTPAADGGLKKGDLLVSVNGRNLKGMDLDFVVDQIAGPINSRVLVGIRRDDKPSSLVTLTRRRVPIYSVSDVSIIDEAAKVGYLRLDRFAKSSAAEMDKALWDLHRQGMQSLVIDLRGNPGGLLTTAIDISNKFLPCGTIVSTRGRLDVDNSLEKADYEQTWQIPLVVLVDGNSASASEIFAAAIQDNQRGIIVGRKSYGKGTVQTHFPLRSVSGTLKLTTAKFYSPDGRVMAGSGVTPDVTVPMSGDPTDYFGTNDPDIQRALVAAKNGQLSDLAMAHVGCKTGANHDLQFGN